MSPTHANYIKRDRNPAIAVLLFAGMMVISVFALFMRSLTETSVSSETLSRLADWLSPLDAFLFGRSEHALQSQAYILSGLCFSVCLAVLLLSLFKPPSINFALKVDDTFPQGLFIFLGNILIGFLGHYSFAKMMMSGQGGDIAAFLFVLSAGYSAIAIGLLIQFIRTHNYVRMNTID